MPMFGPPSTELSKPSVPYAPGWKFIVKSHSPPPPTPALEDFCTNKEVDMSEREYRYPLDRCVRHPPLAGGDDERKSIPRVRLEIVEPIQVGDGHNSQVFTARVLSVRSKPKSGSEWEAEAETKSGSFSHILPPTSGPDGDEKPIVLAKVYDPLYYNDDCGYINPFRAADLSYTHETKTYMTLEDHQGVSIPKYYGSYTFDILVESKADSVLDSKSLREQREKREKIEKHNQSRKLKQSRRRRKTTAMTTKPSSATRTKRTKARTVRMILLEYIQGMRVADANPKHFSQSGRQRMLSTIIDVESKIYQRDILIYGLSTRNIIIRDRPPDERNSCPDPSVAEGDRDSDADGSTSDLDSTVNDPDTNRNIIIHEPDYGNPDIMFVDFGDACFGRGCDIFRIVEPYSVRGKYISPLLRWRTFKHSGAKIFKDWIDWDYDAWVAEEFEHTAGTITEEIGVGTTRYLADR